MGSWKRDFASGLIVLVPIVVTLYVIYWLFGLLSNITLFTQLTDTQYQAVAATLAVFVLIVFSVGYLMRTAAGSILEALIDYVMNRLPVLRIVYNASKMAVETVLSDGTGEFQQPVRVEPWPGMRLTAFKTGKKAPDGREVVFMPTAPNITTGFVMEVEPEDLEETDESVEDALTRVLSAGFGENDDSEVAIDELLPEDDDDENEE
ncbi:DUF502 domain-containing protein [Halobacterium salinarum]|uniref:DUF502 family protein n=1 Tax=Halobacterium salinarum (strain ATCC 33171 / DSM 3754 / JCM 8978 / NBRC 102687 / NCIMB 764 / 91-R6) TaxID=2597657 RepID=A0A4D6GV35_HALS9|nr:DUF502 domain-containing protein [Halobacterium salinarum]MDL0126260.1 DUF502 domain-containing protein [Halobacterium salinarum]MDL0144734.1 DUF502 domain-containing protein [Halobacterium salinarum]QCC45750.1 DUF502 family protein [Halobacterium salinarum]TYO82009.1 putative membrane protein [Halobacterium salinarum DSM 3754]